MKIFEKLFCKHNWKIHAKKEYQWQEKVEGTWDKMEIISKTREVLICKKCGKIKTINY